MLLLLSIEVTGHAGSLAWMLRLAVRVLLLVAPFAEDCIVADSVHLGLVLLAEIERVRLEMVGVARQLPLHILLLLNLLGISYQFADHALFLHRG